MDITDQHRSFLFVDELTSGDRNPSINCRKERQNEPIDGLVNMQHPDGFDYEIIGLDGDPAGIPDDSTGTHQVGRFGNAYGIEDTTDGAPAEEEVLTYPDFKDRRVVNWTGQNFAAHATLWELDYSVMVTPTAKKFGFTPVVDDCGMVIAYYQGGLSTKQLFSNEENGEIFFSTLDFRNKPSVPWGRGAQSIGGRQLWLTSGGSATSYQSGSTKMTPEEFDQTYHEAVPPGNKCNVLLDVDGFVLTIYTYLDPPPPPKISALDLLLGFILPTPPSDQCIAGESSANCALEMGLFELDIVFLFLDVISLGTAIGEHMELKALRNSLHIAEEARNAFREFEAADKIGREARQVSSGARSLVVEGHRIEIAVHGGEEVSKSGKPAKRILAADKSGKKVNLRALSHDSGMTNMAIRDVREKMIKNEARVRFRPAGDARKLRKRGAIPKWEDLKMKTIGEDDLLLGAPKEGLRQPGYFEPKMPDSALKASNPERYEQVMKRYNMRKEEFYALQDTVLELYEEGTIIVENGVVKHRPSGRAIAGDYDIYEILDKNGDRITHHDPRYQRIIDDLSGRRIQVQHGAHVEWEPTDPFEIKIKNEIIERHRTSVPLYEFREDGSVWEVKAD